MQLVANVTAPQRGGAPPNALARTMLGLVSADLLPKPPPPSGAPSGQPGAPVAPGFGERTLLGMPSAEMALRAVEAARAAQGAKAPAERDPRLSGGTLVIGTPAAMEAQARAPLSEASGIPMGQPAPWLPSELAGGERARTALQPMSRTLVGVARPGIAPLAPGVTTEPGGGPLPLDKRRYDAPTELGETITSRQIPWPPAAPPMSPQLMHARRMHRRSAPPPAKAPPRARRALALVIAAGVLAFGAVLFVLLWPDAPPITARARTDAKGQEILELRCETCPDGTVVAIGEGRATMAGRVAQIPLAAPLSIGENRLKVAIDRPENGRDETLAITTGVAYRIRPDLSTLQGERPSIQIIVEAMAGTEVSIDGKPLTLTGGRAAASIDVTDAVTGFADESRMLSRQIPYDVRPPEGPREQGVVSVAVGIVPLRIDAPGPSVVIDTESFVLEGRTAKGASIFAGPHPIPVREGGSFAHVMNVSSVGATQFEVRAKMDGMAPRIAKIAVRRVDRLEVAAKDFSALGPIGWAELAAGSQKQIGKPIVLSGEVIEAHQQGHSTVMLLAVSPASGCKGEAALGAGGQGAAPAEQSPPALTACKVRLVQGTQSHAQRGDTLTAYGRVAPPFAAQGGEEIPEVQVDFTLGGAVGGAPPER